MSRCPTCGFVPAGRGNPFGCWGHEAKSASALSSEEQFTAYRYVLENNIPEGREWYCIRCTRTIVSHSGPCTLEWNTSRLLDKIWRDINGKTPSPDGYLKLQVTRRSLKQLCLLDGADPSDIQDLTGEEFKKIRASQKET